MTRRRQFRLALAGSAALSIVLAAFWLVSDSDGDHGARVQTVQATGYSTTLSVAYPPGWQPASTKLTGRAETEIAIGTYELRSTRNSSCPSEAFQDLGPKDALIMLWEIGVKSDLPRRPGHFNEDLSWESGVICAEFVKRGTVGEFSFREKNRGFAIWLVLGREATADRRATAYRILDSLDVRPN